MATICESLEGRLKAAIVTFNHHWRAKEVGSKPIFFPVNLYIFYVECLDVLFSYSFPFLLPDSIVGSRLFSTSMMGMWFILLVLFLNMMAVLGNRRTNDEEDEEVGSGTYHGDDEVERDDDNENDSDDGHGIKPKESSTPLWKYVKNLA